MSDVKSYISLLKERNSAPATMHKVVAAVKNFLHYAYRQGLTDGDISKEMEEEIRLPRIGHQPVKVLSREEVEKLFRLPDLRTLKGRRDMVVLKLGFVQAMRREEMATVNVEEIYTKLDKPFLLIHGKGGKIAPLFSVMRMAKPVVRPTMLSLDSTLTLMVGVMPTAVVPLATSK